MLAPPGDKHRQEDKKCLNCDFFDLCDECDFEDTSGALLQKNTI